MVHHFLCLLRAVLPAFGRNVSIRLVCPRDVQWILLTELSFNQWAVGCNLCNPVQNKLSLFTPGFSIISELIVDKCKISDLNFFIIGEIFNSKSIVAIRLFIVLLILPARNKKWVNVQSMQCKLGFTKWSLTKGTEHTSDNFVGVGILRSLGSLIDLPVPRYYSLAFEAKT